MNDETQRGIPKVMAKPDPKIVHGVAHTLWSIDLDQREPDADTETRKQSWAANRADFGARARRIIRHLNRKGITLAGGVE
jgi:hypothetical protein